jgi:hypothetical protein
MVKSKLMILGMLLAVAGFAVADAATALRQLPVAYGSFAGSTNTTAPQVSTSSYTPSTATSAGSGTTSSASNTTMNWAGYVSKGGTYTAISGSWRIPNVTVGSDPVASDAAWIGIGGDSSSDLIQVGTENIVENGQVASSTFYEQLPQGSETIPTVTVSAGDKVSASIKEVTGGEWDVTISNLTNGESYNNTVYYNSSESSAEWVEEAPSDGSSIIPLDEFGSVSFTGGSTTENGKTVSIAGSNAQPLTMDNEAGQALTTTSAITDGGSGFTVTRTGASNDISGGQYVTVPEGWTRHEPGLGSYGGGWGQSRREWAQYGDPTSYVFSSW